MALIGRNGGLIGVRRTTTTSGAPGVWTANEQTSLRRLGNWPQTNAYSSPSLDLRFAENKNLLDAATGRALVTFIRASSGTYVGSDGYIKTAATNEPRFAHNAASGDCLGLLVEEQRTNSIRNNTMVGAVAGTPGTLPTNWFQTIGTGLASQVIGTGSQNGISYIDIKISGTAGDTAGWNLNFDGSTQVAASSGQSWVGSLYLAIIGGSTAGTSSQFFRVIERTGAGGYVTESNASWSAAGSSLNSSSQLSVVRSSMGATTGFVQFGVYFNTINGAAIDITLRIGMPQLELGAFATSVIPTTTAAATRSADVASITGTNFSSWYNQTEGTVFAQALGVNNVSGSTRRYCEISDGTAAERYLIGYSATNNTRLLVTDNNSAVADITSAASPGNSITNCAGGYKLNSFQLAVNGTLGVEDTAGGVPTVSQLNIGIDSANTANAYLNGTIRRLAYWSTRLTNTTLQQMTQ